MVSDPSTSRILGGTATAGGAVDPTLEPTMPRLTRVCVYAGSSPGADPEFAHAAADLARLLAGRGIGIVYGGASVGLMGVVADAALDAGAEVVGVLPRRLQDREIGHP